MYFRKALILNVGVLSTGFSQLALLAYLSRTASESSLGIIAILTAIHGFMMLLGDFGLTAASVYFMRPVSLPHAWKVGCITLLVLAIVSCCVALLHGTSDLWVLLFALMAAGVFRFSTYIYEAKALLNEEFARLTAAESLSALLGMLGGTLGLSVVLPAAEAFAGGMALYFLTRLVVLYRSGEGRGHARIGGSADLTGAKVFEYLRGIQAARICNYAFNTVEIVVLRYLVGMEFVGRYSRLTHLNNLAVNYSSVFAEKFAFRYFSDAEHSHAALSFFGRRVLPLVLVGGLLLWLVVQAYGEVVLYAIVGPRWTGLAPVFECLSIIVAVRIVNKFFDSIIKAKNLFRVRVVSQLILTTVWLLALLQLNPLTFILAAKAHISLMLLNCIVTMWIVRAWLRVLPVGVQVLSATYVGAVLYTIVAS